MPWNRNPTGSATNWHAWNGNSRTSETSSTCRAPPTSRPPLPGRGPRPNRRPIRPPFSRRQTRARTGKSTRTTWSDTSPITGSGSTRDPLAQLLPPHRAADIRRRFDTEFRPAPWDRWDYGAVALAVLVGAAHGLPARRDARRELQGKASARKPPDGMDEGSVEEAGSDGGPRRHRAQRVSAVGRRADHRGRKMGQSAVRSCHPEGGTHAERPPPGLSRPRSPASASCSG